MAFTLHRLQKPTARAAAVFDHASSPTILKHIIYDTYKSTRAGEEERSPPKFRNSAKSLGLLFLSLLTPTHVLSLRVFGHEIVTSIHTPLLWSNQRPRPDEYEASFQRTSISTGKVVQFIMEQAAFVYSHLVTLLDSGPMMKMNMSTSMERQTFRPPLLALSWGRW